MLSSRTELGGTIGSISMTNFSETFVIEEKNEFTDEKIKDKSNKKKAGKASKKSSRKKKLAKVYSFDDLALCIKNKKMKPLKT